MPIRLRLVHLRPSLTRGEFAGAALVGLIAAGARFNVIELQLETALLARDRLGKLHPDGDGELVFLVALVRQEVTFFYTVNRCFKTKVPSRRLRCVAHFNLINNEGA